MRLKMRCILGGVVVLVFAYLFCLPRQLFKVPYSTVVTDRNGELLGARIAQDGQWRFPPRTDTPEKLSKCLVAFEDKRFYHHDGVDLLAIGRATWQNLKSHRVVSGGSTLTMQTIRLSRKERRTWGEKIIEMILATRLELRASKEEILAMYVSHAPFGGNVVGLDAASWRYFGHLAEEMSWAEAATLAVLPNAPSAIHLSKGRETLLEKRNRLLRRLHEDGIIDGSTYKLAITEPLPAEPHPLPQIAPHVVSKCYLEHNGNRTATTLDKHLQQQVEELAERWSNEFGRNSIRNLAILVIDLPANEVMAYCGNVHFGQSQSGNQVDIVQAPRSTGSILKPFLYQAMLQEGSLLPDMLLPDVPVNINGYAPQNFSQRFEGAVPASEALARSLNIPAVIMLQRYGVAKFHHLLQQIGLSTIRRTPSHYGLSLILGGAEATLWDITCAYADMGRCLLRLPRSSCQLLSSDLRQDSSAGKERFCPEAVWQTFQALTEVNRPEEIDWKTLPSMQTVAWKTGTSYGFRDAWAVGVTPRYAVGVWAGNASGEGWPGLTGARTAAPVLFDVFSLLPSSAWFQRPEGEFIEAEVCKASGHLKGRFCTETDSVLILPSGLRTEACPYHHPVLLSADGQYRLYEGCARSEAVVRKSWFTLPPVWEWYYRQHHPEYAPLPPLRNDCGGEDPMHPMQFIYPPANAHITLPRQLDGTPGNLTAEVAHSRPERMLFWHLDKEFLTQTEDIHQLSLQPSPGKHTLTVVDNEGNSISTTFWIE